MTNAGVNSNPTSKAQKDTPVINPWGGMRLNPSQMVVNGDAQLASTGLIFVLGGDQAASAGNTGVGFYGNLDVQNITLGAALVIETKYGFQPQVGDSFMIVDVSGTRTGAFSGVTEGDVVASFNGIDLTLSYFGGDGNDVVLTSIDNNTIFVGPGHDWLDPLNWSTGEVPGRTEAILIPAFLEFVNLNNASVDVGSIDTDGVDLNLSDSSIKVFGWGYGSGTIRMNPSSIEVNQMQMLDDETGLSFGLGGNTPATPDMLGAGFYGNIKVVDMALNGELDVFLIYGFTPSIGDTFKLIDVMGVKIGSFTNFAEGETVATFDGVDLTLSYLGGDGNDVVLTAIEQVSIFKNSFE